jgi:hypothetical protein
MKKIIYSTLVVLTLIGAGTVFFACDSPSETTPRTENVTDAYLLPKGTILTDAERQEVADRTNEYNEAVNK